jgi:hypothetical protein
MSTEGRVVDRIWNDAEWANREGSDRTICDDLGLAQPDGRERCGGPQQLQGAVPDMDRDRWMRLVNQSVMIGVRMPSMSPGTGGMASSGDGPPANGMPRSSRIEAPSASISMQLPPISLAPR